MSRFTLPVEIECGVETCDECAQQFWGSCSHFKKPLAFIRWASRKRKRLPECLAAAVPVEEPEGERCKEQVPIPPVTIGRKSFRDCGMLLPCPDHHEGEPVEDPSRPT